MQGTSGFYERKLTLSIIQTKEELIKKFEEEFPYPDDSNKLVSYIEKRIGKSFFSDIKGFIFEHPYIEKEWREIYSLHYCKTNYNKTDPYVFRLHILNSDSDLKKLCTKI